MAFPYFHVPRNSEEYGTVSPDMAGPNVALEAAIGPPFRIFVAHQDTGQRGSWRPQASIQFGKALRTSGFLLGVSPEDLKVLLTLLTFLTPNGHVGANLQQLASALHLSMAKTRARLERLLALRWLGQPLVLFHRTESGMETFVLAPGFISLDEEGTQPPSQPVLQSAPRESVIEHSRRTYGRPRAEVERQIADLNGWELPRIEMPGAEVPSPETAGTELTKTKFPESQMSEPRQEGELVQEAGAASNVPTSSESQQVLVRRRLLKVGLLPEQADELLAHFDLVRIQRQLMWLPYRAVRNRAGFLLAAVKDDYAAPASLYRTPIEPEQPSSQTESSQHEALPLLAHGSDES